MKFRWTYIIAVALALAAVAAWFLSRSGASLGSLEYWIFGLALVALIPLAQAINDITEGLAPYLGKITRGLIEATFGNMPEIAIGLFLLIKARESAALLDTNFVIIRGLLIGSVINNTLLVLGVAVTAGALRNGRMRFNANQAAGFASMLALAVVGLALPTLAAGFARDHSDEAVEAASLIVGGILFLTYIMYVGASTFGWGEKVRVNVKKEAATGEGKGEETEEEDELDAEARRRLAAEEAEEAREARASAGRRALRQKNPFIVPLGVVGLIFFTGVIFLMAYFIVGVTDDVIAQTPLTLLSVGLILFPIVCNFGELFAAFRGAWANDMDAAMNVAAGSSVQVPLFVVPALVFISAILAGTNSGAVLTLIFNPIVLIVVGLVTFVYALVNLDGETTWLEGVQLLAFYLMIGVTAFVLPGR